MLNWDEFHAEEKPVVRNNAAVAAAAQQTARPVEEEEPVAAAPARAEPDDRATAVGQPAEREVSAAPANDAVARPTAPLASTHGAAAVAGRGAIPGRVPDEQRRAIHRRDKRRPAMPGHYG